MTILFVLPKFHTNLQFALKALVARGVRVVVLLESPGRAFVPGISVEVMGKHPLSFAAARRLLRRENPDLVVIRKTRFLSQPVYWAAQVQRRPLIRYNLSPLLGRRKSVLFSSITGPLRGRPFFRVTPSRGLRGPHAQPDPRATYIPFPVARSAAGTVRDYAPGGIIRLLCVAKLAEPRKNQRLLIEALEGLADAFPFTLTLVGLSGLRVRCASPEQLAWLRAYPRAGRIGDRVTVREDVAFAAMPDVYAAHDVCILPARKEPLGIAPLEAMGWGCVPLVSSDCGSAGTVAAADEAGLPCGRVFAPNDHAALSDALQWVLAAPEQLSRRGDNAREWARLELSEERFADRFLEMASRHTKLGHSRASRRPA